MVRGFADSEQMVKVKKGALGGRAPTPELAGLWELALAEGDEAFFTDPGYGEVQLVEGEPSGLDAYLGCAEGDAWAALFKEIAWVAEEAEGGLIGYYHQGTVPLDSAPVVLLDNEGSLRLTGATLVEHFAATKGKGLSALKAFCDNAGLPAPTDAKTRKARLKGAPDPGKRLAELLQNATKGAKRSQPGSRPVDRYPAAVRLDDGRYVVVSQADDVSQVGYEESAAFLFDPAQTGFAPIAPTPFKMSLHGRGIGCLPDGRAVFADITETPRVFIYDPAADQWTVGEPLDEPHQGAVSALLPDGRVVLAGGERTYGYMTKVVSCFDIAKGKWSKLGELSVGRMDGVGMLQSSGELLLLGGTVRGEKYPESTESCELFDPKAKKSRAVASLPRAMAQMTGHRLEDGRIVLTDYDGCCIYDPEGESAPQAIDDDRASSRSALLPDGCVVLFTGARSGTDFDASRRAWAFDPQAGSFEPRGETRLVATRLTLVLPVEGETLLLVGGDLFNNIAREPELWDAKRGEGKPVAGCEKPFAKQERHQKKNIDKRAADYAKMMASR